MIKEFIKKLILIFFVVTTLTGILPTIIIAILFKITGID